MRTEDVKAWLEWTVRRKIGTWRLMRLIGYGFLQAIWQMIGQQVRGAAYFYPTWRWAPKINLKNRVHKTWVSHND